MAHDIRTPLPPPAQPFSWATRAGGLMFTAHGPVDARGDISPGDIRQQTRLTLTNLVAAVTAAGARLDDVAQVLVYLVDVGDVAIMDEVYREFFSAPYPNRATVVVQALVHPQMRIELVAYVALPS